MIGKIRQLSINFIIGLLGLGLGLWIYPVGGLFADFVPDPVISREMDVAKIVSEADGENHFTITYFATDGGYVGLADAPERAVCRGAWALPDKGQTFLGWVDDDGTYLTEEWVYVPEGVERDTAYYAVFIEAETPIVDVKEMAVQLAARHPSFVQRKTANLTASDIVFAEESAEALIDVEDGAEADDAVNEEEEIEDEVEPENSTEEEAAGGDEEAIAEEPEGTHESDSEDDAKDELEEGIEESENGNQEEVEEKGTEKDDINGEKENSETVEEEAKDEVKENTESEFIDDEEDVEFYDGTKDENGNNSEEKNNNEIEKVSSSELESVAMGGGMIGFDAIGQANNASTPEVVVPIRQTIETQEDEFDPAIIPDWEIDESSLPPEVWPESEEATEKNIDTVEPAEEVVEAEVEGSGEDESEALLALNEEAVENADEEPKIAVMDEQTTELEAEKKNTFCNVFCVESETNRLLSEVESMPASIGKQISLESDTEEGSYTFDSLGVFRYIEPEAYRSGEAPVLFAEAKDVVEYDTDALSCTITEEPKEDMTIIYYMTPVALAAGTQIDELSDNGVELDLIPYIGLMCLAGIGLAVGTRGRKRR